LALEELPRVHEPGHRCQRGLAPRLPADDVSAVTGVALEPAQPERALTRAGARQGQGRLAGLGARAPVSHVHVDQDVDDDAGRAGRGAAGRHVLGVVDDNHRVGRLGDELHEPRDRRRRHDLRRDQQPADASGGHHLGLAQLGAGDTQRAGLDLALRDLRALVGLGVRADRFAGAAHVPDRIVRAMAQPIIDHRGPRFEALVRECLDGLERIFQTDRGHVLLYPGSGTGAWEATIVNTLSPGDRVLACVNGFFSAGFARTAAAFGVELERLDLPYGAGVPAAEVQARLERDHAHDIRAVLVVHNETSTGVTSDVPAVRQALRRAGHPALLLVDTVSSLASIDFKFDAWGVDVALTGPQKGLMLPPGMAILAASERAIAASEKARCPRSYWDWQPVLERN